MLVGRKATVCRRAQFTVMWRQFQFQFQFQLLRQCLGEVFEEQTDTVVSQGAQSLIGSLRTGRSIGTRRSRSPAPVS